MICRVKGKLHIARSHAGVLTNDKKYEEAIQQLQKYESLAGKGDALSPVDLQLLIGKVYSQWDRHFASALAVYDGIIERSPEDFRYDLSSIVTYVCQRSRVI